MLRRINELARKQKEDGLTNSEWVEQTVLRENYLRQIRGQALSTISSLTVIDPLGIDVTPEKVREKRKADIERGLLQ